MSILSLAIRRLTIRASWRQSHSRLDNAGPEGDYSIFDERPFLQAISETAISDRVDRTQFQGVGRTRIRQNRFRPGACNCGVRSRRRRAFARNRAPDATGLSTIALRARPRFLTRFATSIQ